VKTSLLVDDTRKKYNWEKSRLSVIIFSKKYASSTWCLNELVHILKCKKKYGQMVVSIFYDISPSDVRKQKGSYADAFVELENCLQFNMRILLSNRGMELIGFFPVFNIVVIAIGTLLYMYCRSLTFSSSTSSSGAADAAADDNDDDVDKPPLREKYDVFISFRGEDTRLTFTSHLHAALLRKKIETYIDNRLKKGDEIGPALREAIEKSRLSVIIFSKNYASSTWCLNELVHILECKKIYGQMVVSIFYDISPSDVRKQKGSYADAFAELENRFKDRMDKVIGWKAALGTEKVQAIFFNGEQILDRADFKRMYNMRLLGVGSWGWGGKILNSKTLLLLPNSLRYLFWCIYPLKSLPPEFSLENLVELHMPFSRVTKLWDGGQNPINLKVLNVYCSVHLTALPNLSGSPNIERINLERCDMLVEIPSDIKDLDKLTYLNLSWCKRLKYLPEMPDNLEFLGLRFSGIKELPSSVWSHEKISSLDIRQCDELKELPSNTCKLNVSDFSLRGCRSFEKFWELPRGIGNLDLSSTAIKLLPTSSMECLTTLTLNGCKNLASLPWRIWKLKSLEVFNLRNCSELKVVPSSIYKLKNLKYLSFAGCRKLQYFPWRTGSVGFLSLEEVKLQHSGILEIPQYLKNLDKLTYLDLSLCKLLEYLPEMPGNLESLNLHGSGIKELPLSVWSHEKISSLDITHCEKLKELPSDTCKLKVSGAFSLNGCTSLEKFWELPRGIGKLNLSLTRIKVLPTSSMRCLLCLTKLKLRNCINIASLLPSICKLKSLEELDLSRCSALRVVPSSIYELTNIKTLSFSCCRKLRNFAQPTAGSVGFLSLEVLNLHGSGILEIPEGVICSTSLRVLNLGKTKIRSIPSSIKQVSQLFRLCLFGCKSLRSLPELPMLRRLHADFCKSLKTVSSSRTAITRCWNRYELLQEEHTFIECPSLGYDARSSIMVDSQLRIMRVATASSRLKEEKEDYVCFSTASSNLEEEEEEEYYEEHCECSYKEDYEKYSGPLVTIVCPGDEIPNWFVHQNEGASINVPLPANWFREGFLGFALSFVASKLCVLKGTFRCFYNFKTGEGEIYRVRCKSTIYATTEIDGDDDDEFYFDSHLPHVFVLYNDLEHEHVSKLCKGLEHGNVVFLSTGLERPSALYDRVTEVSVSFEQEWEFGTEVEKCGLCLLYARDAEKLKCDVMSRQEQDEHATSGSGDPEASGSNESEEASGSDDSEGESGSGGRKRKRESEEASGSDGSEGESGRRGSKRRRLVLRKQVEEMSLSKQVEVMRQMQVEGINLLLV
ncbi:hypothetical protein DVH24_034663, partial [Malus domestica]